MSMFTSIGELDVASEEMLSRLHRTLGTGGGAHLLSVLRDQQAAAHQGCH